jgi:hypothetical protein
LDLWQQVLTAEREELEQSFARMKSEVEGLSGHGYLLLCAITLPSIVIS